MLLTGRFFSAQEAKELGLINRVVALEHLTTETEKLAAQIAEASRFVLATPLSLLLAQKCGDQKTSVHRGGQHQVAHGGSHRRQG